MKRTGTITVTLKYKLRRMYGDPNEDYDEDYSHQEIEDYIREELGYYEGDSVEMSVASIKIS